MLQPCKLAQFFLIPDLVLDDWQPRLGQDDLLHLHTLDPTVISESDEWWPLLGKDYHQVLIRSSISCQYIEISIRYIQDDKDSLFIDIDNCFRTRLRIKCKMHDSYRFIIHLPTWPTAAMVLSLFSHPLWQSRLCHWQGPLGSSPLELLSPYSCKSARWCLSAYRTYNQSLQCRDMGHYTTTRRSCDAVYLPPYL